MSPSEGRAQGINVSTAEGGRPTPIAVLIALVVVGVSMFALGRSIPVAPPLPPGLEDPSWLWADDTDASSPSLAQWATRLPDNVEAFVGAEAATAGPCEASAQAAAVGAQALFLAAQGEDVWPLETPSVTSHILLACGLECESPYNSDGLVDDWFLGVLAENEERKLHRGELLALAAEMGLRLDKPIMWRSKDVSSVGELLDETVAEFSVPPGELWDEREGSKGPVYGWEIQALCTYLGPVGELRPGLMVSEAVAQVAKAGPNVATEGGTHDLDGLALCLAEYRASGSSDPDARAHYELVEEVLAERLEQDLSQITPSGQVYADDSSFDACTDKHGPLCEQLVALVRQAHFIEWSSLYVPSCSEPYNRALQHFTALTEDIAPQVSDAEGWWNLSMMLTASTHALHAARRLAWRYESGPPLAQDAGGAE